MEERKKKKKKKGEKGEDEEMALLEALARANRLEQKKMEEDEINVSVVHQSVSRGVFVFSEK